MDILHRRTFECAARQVPLHCPIVRYACLLRSRIPPAPLNKGGAAVVAMTQRNERKEVPAHYVAAAICPSLGRLAVPARVGALGVDRAFWRDRKLRFGRQSVPSLMRLAILSLVVIALAAISGCGVLATRAPSSTVVLGQADAGRMVQVKVGDTVRVTLEEDFPVPGISVVWNVTSLEPSVLRRGPVTRSPQVRSGPGLHNIYMSDL